jgi:hypothetical protein
MNDEDHIQQNREIYARFGVAMHICQVLEHSFANASFAFSILQNKPEVVTPETWAELVDSFYEKEFEKTMGRMLQTLKASEIILSEAMQDLLKEVLKKRNWLAHGYYRDRAEEFMTENGRTKMIAELEEMISLFGKLHESIDKMLKPQLSKYDYSEEILQQAYNESLTVIE